MINFRYIVSNDSDNVTDGYIKAEDIETAKSELVQKGYQIISIKENKSFLSFLSLDINDIFSDTKLSNSEMMNFFSSISGMDSVGIDILNILKLMKDEIAPTKRLRKICSLIHSYVSNGEKFATACQKSSKSFSIDIVGIIKIAEDTGKFSLVFNEIVEYIKWISEIEKRAKSAFRGPALTFIFIIGISIGMSLFALPKVIEFLKYFNMKPPFYTVALIAFSNFIINWWKVMILSVISLFVLTNVLSHLSETYLLKIDYLKLKLPVFGKIMIKIDTARFIAFFALMYNSGVDIINIIESMKKVLKNKYLCHRIDIVHKKVLQGSTIFKSLDEEIIFPNMFRKMMAVSEITGNSGDILKNVKEFYDKETKQEIEIMIGIIKPAMTIFLGFMITWIALAMFGPIYGNIGNLGEKDSFSGDNSIQ